jgi:hypothetical protein
LALIRQRMRPLGCQPIQSQPTDAEFIGRLPSFRSTGGLATSYEIEARMKHASMSRLPPLGRRIASRELVSFIWSGRHWLPCFQFAKNLQLTDASAAVLGELRDVLDGWELAQWFCESHPTLGGRTPITVLETDAQGALEAARLTRFVARG